MPGESCEADYSLVKYNALQVNLQYSAEICANLNENKELQIKTQEYVSGVQVIINT